MKKYILLPNVDNAKSRIHWIKAIREITGLGLKEAKEDFCDKVYVKEGTINETIWVPQEYSLDDKDFIKMGLNEKHILEYMIKEGYIRCEGESSIRGLIDEALNSRKYKHAIELIKVLEKLGEM